MHNIPVNMVKDLKYVGVTLDCKQKQNPHVKNTGKKKIKAIFTFQCLYEKT